MSADTRASAPVTLPPLGPLGTARWAWRQLTSMRTALMLLVLLAVAAVPGSVLPQRRIDPTRVSDYLSEHSTAGPWLDRIGAFDVYTSVWFSAIYLLLFVSLVGCVLPRARVHLKALRTPPPAPPSRLNRMPEYRRLDPAPGGEAGEASLEGAVRELRRRRYRVRSYPGGVSAERGYLAETGNLIFHLALVGLLCALAWGSLGTYTGQVVIPAGQSFANLVPNYDEFNAGRLVDTANLPPFTMKLDKLEVAFDTQADALGAPRKFDATLTVKDSPTSPERKVLVKPNQPLDVAGTRAFLVGNGYAPLITVKDGQGNVVQRGPITARPMDGNYKSVVVVKVPDAKPRQLGLIGVFLPTYDDEDGVPVSVFPDAISPRVVLQVWEAKPGEDGLGVNNGVPQSVFKLDTENMTRVEVGDKQPLLLSLEPGQGADLPGGAGSVTFEGYVRFAAFDVRRDPSRLWALLFSATALAGLTASLFVRRRRVWVRPARGGAGGAIEIAGLSRSEDSSLGAEIDSLAQALGLPAPDPRSTGSAPGTTAVSVAPNSGPHGQELSGAATGQTRGADGTASAEAVADGVEAGPAERNE